MWFCHKTLSNIVFREILYKNDFCSFVVNLIIIFFFLEFAFCLMTDVEARTVNISEIPRKTNALLDSSQRQLTSGNCDLVDELGRHCGSGFPSFSTVVVPEHDLSSWSHCGARLYSLVTLRGRSLGLVQAGRERERERRSGGAARRELEPRWKKHWDTHTQSGSRVTAEAVSADIQSLSMP